MKFLMFRCLYFLTSPLCLLRQKVLSTTWGLSVIVFSCDFLASQSTFCSHTDHVAAWSVKQMSQQIWRVLKMFVPDLVEIACSLARRFMFMFWPFARKKAQNWTLNVHISQNASANLADFLAPTCGRTWFSCVPPHNEDVKSLHQK